LAGVGTDDLDALILNDFTDGSFGTYTPTAGPYSWLGLFAAPTDMLLFSLRRGSAQIGTPDGIYGAPIEEGDILVPMGPGLPPGIWIAAEALGLATVRSGTAAAWGVPNPQYLGADMWADDLDALDVSVIPEPATAVLMLLALIAAAGQRRR
jgi:hypothetical protein